MQAETAAGNPTGVRKGTTMWRGVLSLILLLHGAGHVLFLANAWGYWKTGAGRAGWFAQALGVGQRVEGIIGLLWLVPIAGFIVAAWGYFTRQGWWPPVMLAVAVMSLVLLFAFWSGLNTSSAFFALLVDVGVIGLVLWQGRAGLAG